MSDYYIRTPEQDESRGPFNIAKLSTLAEADQISENTLYYDETKEEWIPIALNEELKAQVFPQREKLSLQIGESADEAVADASSEEGGINVEDMLKAAEADTEETRHLKKSQKSFERAVALSSMSLGLMMLLSAVFLILPHLSQIQSAVNDQLYPSLLNYPFLLVAAFDLIVAILLLLAVTEVFPLVRARSMLTVGFGVYVGWALGDVLIMAACGLGGLGIFLATISQRLSLMLLAIIAGVTGNGLLAYLAFNERFVDFFDQIQFNLVSS